MLRDERRQERRFNHQFALPVPLRCRRCGVDAIWTDEPHAMLRLICGAPDRCEASFSNQPQTIPTPGVR